VVISIPDKTDKGSIHFRSWLLTDNGQFKEEAIADYQFSKTK
jgi:hypothetical protein